MRGVMRWNIPYLKAYDTRTLVFYLHVEFVKWSQSLKLEMVEIGFVVYGKRKRERDGVVGWVY
jgi:hypothetical protein